MATDKQTGKTTKTTIKSSRGNGNKAAKRPTANKGEGAFSALASVAVSRAILADKLGKSFGFGKYYARYTRQDIAKRIIDAPVDACWRRPPNIVEDMEDETEFEKAWVELQEKLKIYHYLARTEKLAGIYQYAALLIGYKTKDGNLKEPVSGVNNEVLFLRPYAQQNAEILKWDEDKNSSRYGMPEIYSLTTSTPNRNSTGNIEAHHSRILHITEGRLEDEVFGTPALQSVYNRLQDLEMVSGGSAEMFWRGAFPGYNFNLDEDADFSQTLTDMQDEIEEYMHGFKRYLRLQGIDVQSLTPQVADPSKHISILLDLIAGATKIPKRILIGSERGELASSQDETNWNNTVDERRKNYVEPWVLRAFIDRMMQHGVLKGPAKGYTVDWPQIHEPSEKDEAQLKKELTTAIAEYARTPGIENVMPLPIWLTKVMKFNKADVEEIMESIDSILEDENKRIEEERALEEEARRAAEEEDEMAAAMGSEE
jgi:phage-related protein (TIGR01555 family)